MTRTQSSGPVVAVADLRAGLELVLSAVERHHGSHVDLDGGHYWDLGLADAFAVLSEPGEPKVGDLADDATSLTELLDRDLGEVHVWHDLGHLVGLLRRVAALDLPSAGRA